MQTCTKICCVCNNSLPVSAFAKNSFNAGGLDKRCKSCQRQQIRENKQRKDYAIQSGLYAKLYEEQNGACGICRTPIYDFKENKREGDKVPILDHCHYTGAIRGLLCKTCNTALGQFGDTVEGLKNAISYLEK